jgi:hypothetical protein
MVPKKADRLKRKRKKKIKRKSNPMARLLSLPNFQQKKIKSKKLYNRNKVKFTLLNWEDGGQ